MKKIIPILALILVMLTGCSGSKQEGKNIFHQ